jgi:hypothetical protein
MLLKYYTGRCRQRLRSVPSFLLSGIAAEVGDAPMAERLAKQPLGSIFSHFETTELVPYFDGRRFRAGK